MVGRIDIPTLRNAALAAVTTGLLLPLVPDASAAQSGNQICQKMIADGRGGELSQSDCLCTHRVADAVLDDDLKSQLFDAWLTGRNNMQAMGQLPNQRRVDKQLRTFQRSLKVNCE